MNDRTGQRFTARTGAEGDPPLTLEGFLPHRLLVCAQFVSAALAKVHAGRHEIGVPEWRVLVVLAEFGSMTAKAIGQRSHMHKTKVSRAVAVIEELELVTRRSNTADLREPFLSLTPAGRTLTEQAMTIQTGLIERIMSETPEDRCLQVAEAMEDIIRILQTMEIAEED